ncbi:hypothetical protein [Tuwongella immobilis]|uniref:Uncharacterized protein n=1 Tax=Tuwongella immobilis TaxID=692036 RepID=A0A6C2YQT9_9BACT|nr:hypothetical protein [Tuwongella immobilis]VIP03764.1 unnamed protein product [Tuwongella immobilis]VTS04896.1 unnamed protein product [Tuwongella immobilis]
MAGLTSGNYHLDFNIYPIDDPVHDGWHNYSVQIINRATGDEAHLVATSDNPLFMNCSIMPEVPLLCAGIREIADTGGEMAFQPMDEKDFTMKVRADGVGYVIQLTWDNCPRTVSLGWPTGVHVSKQQLLEFTEQLMTEYLAIVD